MPEMKKITSCSGCLKQVLEHQLDKSEIHWEDIGMNTPHCGGCKKALRDKGTWEIDSSKKS